MESYFIGFDRETLAERFDTAAAQRRLDEIADFRGLVELVEKISLLTALDRLDDARSTAIEAMRQGRFGNDREPLMQAKVANSRILRADGRNEQAISELTDVIIEAEAYGRSDLIADALRQRALCRLALDEGDLARTDLNEALAVLVRANAAPREIDTTMIAVGALLDRRG